MLPDRHKAIDLAKETITTPASSFHLSNFILTNLSSLVDSRSSHLGDHQSGYLRGSDNGLSMLGGSETTSQIPAETVTLATDTMDLSNFFGPGQLSSDACQSTNSPNGISCSNQSIYDRMRFCPREMNFSDFMEVWIRKSTSDILIRVAFVAPILLLGIVGNLTIIYSMCKFKPFRSKPTNIFILNMAIADLLTTIVCPNAALFTDIYQFYVLGSFLCRFEGFVKITCFLVSSYSLIVLSTDWLLCVVKPCRTRISIKQSWLALSAIWISSVLMASPLFIWRQLRERQWKDVVEIWCCELIEYTKYYWVVITFFLIYLPIIFMTIVLVIILLYMDRFESKLKRSRAASTSSNTSLSISMKYRRRIVKILVLYLLTSIICWAPLQFAIIYRHFRSESVLSPWFFQLLFYAQLSASLSAAMNPITFGFLSQPFRRIVAKSFMFKFLDKMMTTNNSRPPTGANRNDGVPMNQMNLNKTIRTHNNPSNTRVTNRSSNHQPSHVREIKNHSHISSKNMISSQQNVNITSFMHQNNNNNKRVSFNTSASIDSQNVVRDSLGCDNVGFDLPDDG